MVPPLPGGLFGGAGEAGNTAPGPGSGQSAGRNAQAFADVLTESEQGLKGGRVGAVGERIQQGADGTEEARQILGNVRFGTQPFLDMIVPASKDIEAVSRVIGQ